MDNFHGIYRSIAGISRPDPDCHVATPFCNRSSQNKWIHFPFCTDSYRLLSSLAFSTKITAIISLIGFFLIFLIKFIFENQKLLKADSLISNPLCITSLYNLKSKTYQLYHTTKGIPEWKVLES